MNEEWTLILQRIEEERMAVLSEVSDWGLEAFQNARLNWEKEGPFRHFSALKNSCPGMPGVVSGAGPSLEEAMPFLSTLESKALILAAGTALPLLGSAKIKPHLFFAFDKGAPSKSILEQPFRDIPCCFQSRLSPQCLSLFQGEKILAPESGPLPWEDWWFPSDEKVPFGWTVGNFALQGAIWMGCNPIILTGMDLCYRQGKKYAMGKKGGEAEEVPLISEKNSQGKPVWTQRDFLLSAAFCRKLSEENPHIRFINTSSNGLSLGPLIETVPWASLSWEKEWDLRGHLHAVLEKGERVHSLSEKEIEWRRSRERCVKGELLAGEPVYEYYLAPLWRIYERVFVQEIGEQDLDLHRQLFFQRVLEKL
jgi:hypothetical protein